MTSGKLMQELKQYGANMGEAMERFMDDEELYVDCLMMFMQDPSFKKLETALDSQDYHAAFEAAHTLKGVAGNLGLTPVYTDICELVELLRAGKHDNLLHAYEEIQEQMVVLQELIDQCKD